jgi:hypothetical protein
LHVDGLIERNSFLTVYPSSKPGMSNAVLREFVQPASSLFHAYFREDLLVRGVEAIDSSMERVQARDEGREPAISFLTQANTVHVNPRYETGLQGRDVIVFDDFTTTGMSQEWARNALYAAGARSVTSVAIGKYPKPHTIFEPREGVVLQPFEVGDYSLSDFVATPMTIPRNIEAQRVLRDSFAAWRVDEELTE